MIKSPTLSRKCLVFYQYMPCATHIHSFVKQQQQKLVSLPWPPSAHNMVEGDSCANKYVTDTMIESVPCQRVGHKERGLASSLWLGCPGGWGKTRSGKASDERVGSSPWSPCSPGRLFGDGVYCGKNILRGRKNMRKCSVAWPSKAHSGISRKSLHLCQALLQVPDFTVPFTEYWQVPHTSHLIPTAIL